MNELLELVKDTSTLDEDTGCPIRKMKQTRVATVIANFAKLLFDEIIETVLKIISLVVVEYQLVSSDIVSCSCTRSCCLHFNRPWLVSIRPERLIYRY